MAEGDKWRLSFYDSKEQVDPLTRKPLGYAVLEVVIHRKLVIPTVDSERISSAAAALDFLPLQELVQIYREASAAVRPHIRVDWTPPPNGVLPAQGIDTIFRDNLNLVSWRIEGDPLKGESLRGILNVVGKEHVIDLSKDAIQPQFERFSRAYRDGESVMKDPTATDVAKDVAAATLGILGAIMGGAAALMSGTAGGLLAAGLSIWAAIELAEAAADDAAKKAAEAQAAAAERAGAERVNESGDVMIKVGHDLYIT